MWIVIVKSYYSIISIFRLLFLLCSILILLKLTFSLFKLISNVIKVNYLKLMQYRITIYVWFV